MSRPEFIDNRDGNTLAQAINAYVESLDNRLAADPDLDVVTGYFNPNGYFSISDALDTVGEVRLLLGAEPPEKDRERWRKPGEPRGEEYDQTLVDEALRRLTRASSVIVTYSDSPERLMKTSERWSTG